MGNITFGSFIAEKRKAHKFNLRDTAKHLNIAYGYLCDIEQSRRPAPNGDFVERISAFLNLDKSEHELLLDLAAKSRNTRVTAPWVWLCFNPWALLACCKASLVW